VGGEFGECCEGDPGGLDGVFALVEQWGDPPFGFGDGVVDDAEQLGEDASGGPDPRSWTR
jgi:hypothetical protein